MEINDDFVRQYGAWVKECLDHAKLSPDTFDDVQAKVWEKIMLQSDNYDPERGKVTTWIWQIVRSVISNHTRDLSRSTDALDHAESFADNPNLIGYEDAGEARDELKRLYRSAPVSPRDTQLLHEYHVEGMTVPELEEKYSLSRRGVEQILYRTMKALRQTAEG